MQDFQALIDQQLRDKEVLRRAEIAARRKTQELLENPPSSPETKDGEAQVPEEEEPVDPAYAVKDSILSQREILQLEVLLLNMRRDTLALQESEPKVAEEEALQRSLLDLERQLAAAGGIDLSSYLMRGYATQIVPISELIVLEFRTVNSSALLVAAEASRVLHASFRGKKEASTPEKEEYQSVWLTHVIETLCGLHSFSGAPGPFVKLNWEADPAVLRDAMIQAAREYLRTHDQPIIEFLHRHYTLFTARVRKALNNQVMRDAAKKN